MTARLFTRFTAPLVGLAVMLLLAGCSGQQLTSSVEDQSMVSTPEEEVDVVESASDSEAQMDSTFATEPETTSETMMESMAETESQVEGGLEQPYVEEAYTTEPEPELPMAEEVYEEPYEEAYTTEPEPSMDSMAEGMPEAESYVEEEVYEEPYEEAYEEAYATEPEPSMDSMAEVTPDSMPYVEETYEEAYLPESGMGDTEGDMYASVDQDAMVEMVEPEQLPDMTQEMLALDDVYFDFDRFSIRNEARNTLELNARQLGDREDWDLTIEGHCDERGTIAYNLVLGERRAEAVKRYLEDLGLPGHKIGVASYGKERPACFEESEACWQENRRVHFVH